MSCPVIKGVPIKCKPAWGASAQTRPCARVHVMPRGALGYHLTIWILTHPGCPFLQRGGRGASRGISLRDDGQVGGIVTTLVAKPRLCPSGAHLGENAYASVNSIKGGKPAISRSCDDCTRRICITSWLPAICSSRHGCLGTKSRSVLMADI